MTITISIFSKTDIVQAYASLVRRFTRKHNPRTVEQYLEGRNCQEIDLATLMSILDSSDHQALANSTHKFYVGVGYELFPDYFMPISIYFYGKNYGRGLQTRYDSSCQIHISYRDLWRIVKFKPRYKKKNENNLKFETGFEGIKPVLNKNLVEANNNSANFFLTACGLLEPKDNSYIDHAAMYYLANCLSPLTNPMIYHRNPVEFARDFERIYAEYHWGIPTPLMLDSKIDIWKLTKAEINDLVTYLDKTDSPLKDYPRIYTFFSKPHDILPEQKESDLINFIESLDPETVKKLSKLSPSFIRQALANLEQELPEIHSYDFQSRGIALTSGVLMSVWRAYQYLAQLAALELG
jgi:hypothetical protein